MQKDMQPLRYFARSTSKKKWLNDERKNRKEALAKLEQKTWRGKKEATAINNRK